MKHFEGASEDEMKRRIREAKELIEELEESMQDGYDESVTVTQSGMRSGSQFSKNSGQVRTSGYFKVNGKTTPLEFSKAR